MLSADQLALMQNAAAAWRTTPCSIQRTTQASDGMGGQIDTWAEISAPTCFIGPVGGGSGAGAGSGEKIEGERVEELSRFRIRLPAGQDVTIRDRIVAAGTTYEVQDVETRTIEVQRVVLATVVTS